MIAFEDADGKSTSDKADSKSMIPWTTASFMYLW